VRYGQKEREEVEQRGEKRREKRRGGGMEGNKMGGEERGERRRGYKGNMFDGMIDQSVHKNSKQKLVCLLARAIMRVCERKLNISMSLCDAEWGDNRSSMSLCDAKWGDNRSRSKKEKVRIQELKINENS